MTRTSVQLSLEELQALLELVDNQLFRMKYIDPKIPGYKADAAKLRAANSAVDAVREAFKGAKGFKATA
jgi:hypothetical protein